jgi:hypothetical protein
MTTASAEAELGQRPPADHMLRRSRRDLARLHHAVGSRLIVARAWEAFWPPGDTVAPLNILDLGAGDGTLSLAVARSLPGAWSPVHLTLLDRDNVVSPTTLAGFADIGWNAIAYSGDVLDWAERPAAVRPRGASAPPWDLITTCLFLHHFERTQLKLLLGAIAQRTQHFFACEPRRYLTALASRHLVGATGANAVTRRDAVLSVRAGFRDRELTNLWPGPSAGWRLNEYAAGDFTHCFSARRHALSSQSGQRLTG